MQQISQNLIVIGPSDQWNEAYDGAIKIYLSGTIDLGKPEGWQDKFVSALTKMTDPINGDPRFKGKSWVVMNPRGPIQNPTVSLDNQEFVGKTRWELEALGRADIVFCNLQKKSKSPSALYGLLLTLHDPGRLIVRCPLEYVMYPVVKIMTESAGIRVLGDTATAKDVMEAATRICEKLRDNEEYGLE